MVGTLCPFHFHVFHFNFHCEHGWYTLSLSLFCFHFHFFLILTLRVKHGWYDFYISLFCFQFHFFLISTFTVKHCWYTLSLSLFYFHLFSHFNFHCETWLVHIVAVCSSVEQSIKVWNWFSSHIESRRHLSNWDVFAAKENLVGFCLTVGLDWAYLSCKVWRKSQNKRKQCDRNFSFLKRETHCTSTTKAHPYTRGARLWPTF